MKKRTWIIGISAFLLILLAAKGIGWYRWSQLSSAEKAGTITEKMARHFDLSESQRNQIYALNLAKVEAMTEAHQSKKHDRAAWKELHKNWKAEVQAVLTPEQRRQCGGH